VAAVANVAINVDSRGAVGKLREVVNRSKEVSAAVDRMNGNVGKSSRQFKNAGVAASQASAGFSKLGKAIGGIVTAAAAFQALKFTIVKTAELETQTRSLKVLTGSLESAQSIIKQLQDIGAVTPFTSTELIDTAKRLRAFGVETDKLVDTTRRLGDVAGATGADLGGIATAFGQIQAKGRLQGEELLQLQERGIDLQSELQRMYGMTGEEFRKALEKGKFSAEAVDVALQNLTNTGGKYANGAIAQSDTLAGKFSTLQDGITRTAQAIGQVLSPALQTILTQAIGVVNSINNALAAGRRIQQFGIDASKRNELFKQAGKEAEEIARLRGGGKIDPGVFTQLRDERFKDLIEAYGYETGQIQVETKVPTLETPSVPELLGGGGANRNGAAGGGGAAAQLKEQKDLSDAIYALELKRQDIRFQNNELLKIQVDKELEFQKILESEMKPRERLVALQNAENNAIEKAAQLMAPMIEGVEELQNGATAAGKAFAQLYIDADNAKLAEKAKELDNLYRSIGDTITTSIVDSLTAAVEGTKSLAEVASNTLRSIANILLKFGLNTLTSGLAGDDGVGFFSKLFGGGRASGGTVRGGTSYLVGERGPELFTPNRSGSIAPNGSMGGATVVVNVDASGTQAQGNNQNAKQLGQAIGAAVQAELIKQKRPGGLLAS
jgi:tape measure domain-containing protein